MENVAKQQNKAKVKQLPGMKKLSIALMTMGHNMDELRIDQVLDLHDKGIGEYREMFETVGAYRADPNYVAGTRLVESLFRLDDEGVPKVKNKPVPYLHANKAKRVLQSAKMTARDIAKRNGIVEHDNCQNG